MKLYRIKDWESIFETSETRKLKDLKWVAVPNKHDGLGFRRMVSNKDRCELFSAWNLILQVASRGKREERGILIRGGHIISAGDLGCMTGFPAEIFARALDFFSSPEIGWLVVDNQQSAAIPAGDPAIPVSNPAEEKEGKGREEPEGKGRTSGAGLVFPEGLKSETFIAVWEEWVQCRKKKKSCKDWNSMFQKQLDFLGTFPEDTARAMLNQSIMNDWQGLFEIKPPTYKTNGNHTIRPADLKSIMQAKESEAQDLRRKYCSEVATGDTWSDQGKRQEYFVIKKKLKELNTQLGAMA